MAENFTEAEMQDEEALRNDDFDSKKVEKELELLEDQLDLEKDEFLNINKKK